MIIRLGFTVLLTAFGLLALIETSFAFKESAPFDFGPRYYIHRCGQPENTLKGASTAVQAGYKGLECDIFFDAEKQRFVLTHDWPAKKDAITLGQLLKAIDNKNMHYWLDYKNAERRHQEQALKRIRELIAKHDLKHRYFVESTNGWHQMLWSHQGVNTSLWLRTYKKSRIGFIRRYLDRIYAALGAHVSVSYAKESFLELGIIYKHFPNLVFTVNNPAEQKQFEKFDNIKIILKDL